MNDQTAQERTRAFLDMLDQIYPTGYTLPQVAADFGVTRQTFMKWKRENAVPDMAYFLAEERSGKGDTREDWAEIVAQLGALSRLIHATAGQLTDLTNHIETMAGKRAGKAD